MNRLNRSGFIGLLCLMLTSWLAQAQYSVSGGSGTPLMAYYNEPNRLEVYLVYGNAPIEISYTSSASGDHRWFRYQEKAVDGEAIASEQTGNSSVVRNVSPGYGYYVEESGQMTRFVWIINYQQYAFEVNRLQVEGNCSGFWLEGEPQISQMYYRLPANGQAVELKREFEVSFQTLIWSELSYSFNPVYVTRTIEGNPYSGFINNRDTLPLCDTEVTLRGDQFARHFGVEKSMNSDLYQAVIVELHTDTIQQIQEAENMTGGEGSGLSAPAEITFRAYANDPVAAMYRWKIYRSDVANGSESPLINFPSDEVTYTFREWGQYVAEVEVSNRSGSCSETYSYDIQITESFLDVPNAFSPGTTPGFNDEFRVAYKSLVRYKIWIFNRWGNELWHSSNPAQGWDGKKGGKYVPPGVYFYVIEATGSDGIKYNRKGSINILRPKNIDEEVVN